MIPRRWSWWPVLASLLLAAGVGCGGKGKPVPVQGTVTLDSKPLDHATVLFVPQDKGGQASSALTDDTGNYTLKTPNVGDGALPGAYKVVITRSVDMGSSAAGEDPAKAVAEWRKKQREAKRSPQKQVPQVYSSVASTTLTYTVEPAGGKADFNLKK